MPLPLDDNNRPVQTLHPLRSHVLNLTHANWQTTAEFLTADTVAVELQPEFDVVFMFGDMSPEIYLRTSGYFVYDVRKYKSLKAKPAPWALEGRLIVTELG